MGASDPAADGQTEAAALRIRALGEALKEPGDQLRVDAGPVVLDLQPRVALFRPDAQAHAGAGVTERVGQQVANELFESPLVAVDDSAAQLQIELDRAGVGVACNARGYAGEIDGFPLEHVGAAAPGQGQEVAEQRSARNARSAMMSSAARRSSAEPSRAAWATLAMAVSGVRNSWAASAAKRASRSRASASGRTAARASAYEAAPTIKTSARSQSRIVPAIPLPEVHQRGAGGRRAEGRFVGLAIGGIDENEGQDAERRDDAGEDCEIGGGQTPDGACFGFSATSLYPIPQTVAICAVVPEAFSLRRSWLTYTSTILLEPWKS